jgi:hypothetical protein
MKRRASRSPKFSELINEAESQFAINISGVSQAGKQQQWRPVPPKSKQ